MEEQTTSEARKSNMGPIMGVIGIIVVVGIGIVVAQGLNKPKQATEGAMTSVKQTTQQQPTEAVNSASAPSSTPSGTTEASAFKDGTYSATGNYVSPGGPEELGVTLTIAKGVVTDSTVEVKATRPMSKTRQTDFADHYKSEVIGKNLDSLELGKVSGSSLAPKGFNDAVSKIKQEAKA